MPEFDRLYLDTTTLRKSNWPHVSAELGFLFGLAKNFRIQVVIPEPAEAEREEQWIRDLPLNTGVIKPLAITVTTVADKKTYDGTTSSSGKPAIAPPLISPDSPGIYPAL